jgi:signal transduction histidine kinase
MLGHALCAGCEQPAWKQAQVHPEDRERVDASLRTALEQRAVSWSAEYRFRRGDGTYAQVLDRAVVSYAPSGEPTRLVGAMADLTAQRELQTQLSLAERMATVGTLAAGVAHEINNPLCYLLGNLDFVLEALGAPQPDEPRDSVELRRAIQEAREGAERVRLIVRELKTFSRGDEESVGPVDVHGPLESALLIAANEINHRAALRRDYADVPHVQANEARLAQVFLNLLINAVQALPADGAKRNEIRVVTRLGTEGRVVLEISDNGQGIPRALHARIFEPFFTTKPIGEGTGLGLWVCHRLITRLGGSIAVDSEPGRGSTFRILLPVAEGPARPVTV